MIGVLIPKGNDRLFSSLVFQKKKDFKVYVPEGDLVADAYEGQLPLVRGGLNDVAEPYVWILEEGALPGKDFLRRALHTLGRHPEFDVYHACLAEGDRFPRILKKEKLFRKLVLENVPAPFSSFIFSTAQLKGKAVFRADGALDPLPTILACAWEKGLRNIWHGELEWEVSAVPPSSPAEEEKRIRERLDFFHWTESFFGEDYPVGLGERLGLFAGQVAKLFPSYSEDSLKEMMQSFRAAEGPVRKLRANSALKSALKARQQALK